MALSGLEKSEIRSRTMGMRDDELQYTLKCIPTEVLLAEIGRRSGRIDDMLGHVCDTWNDMTVNKSIMDMDIVEREQLLRELRRVLHGYE